MAAYEEMVWRLVPNKIVRYPGGREIDRFRGVRYPQDDRRPEAWVGSDTRTGEALQKEDPSDGCSLVLLPDQEEIYLYQAIARNPEKILGPGHVKNRGKSLGVLVKLLDAQYQLGLQCHPSRAYAKKFFRSDYGKEESWYVIGLRDDTPEPPYVLLGFKEGATREQFEHGYRRQDIHEMESLCHKVPVHVGDTFFIEAGLPHAIGGGVFVVEVQEPSDITMGTERLAGEHTEEENRNHDEILLGCYNYAGRSPEENLKKYQIAPKTLREGDWGRECQLIGPGQTSYFSFTRLDASSDIPLIWPHTAQVGIVLEGSGILRTPHADLRFHKSTEFFIPFSCKDVSLIPDPGQSVSMILAKPEVFD